MFRKGSLIYLVIGVLTILLCINIIFNIPKYNSVKKENHTTYEIPKQEYYKAKVLDIKEGKADDNGYGQEGVAQYVKAEIYSGNLKGQKVDIINNVSEANKEAKTLSVNEKIILTSFQVPNGEVKYVFYDKERIGSIYYILILFLIILFVVVGKKSVGSLLGLLTSVGIIFYFTIPQIVGGYNIISIGLLSALLITVITIYMAHGLNKLSNISILSVLFTLLIVVNLSFIFTNALKLFGTGDETALYLQFSKEYFFNLKALLIVSIIISAVGVLDDVASSQIATVKQLSEANKLLNVSDLFNRAMDVGREHIASMVNSLVLVYVGMALPLIVALSSDPTKNLFINLNFEGVIQEIVSSLIVSIGLILTVPIASYMAAVVYSKRKV